MSDTPRTDAELDDARNIALEFSCRIPEPAKGENCYVVSADFARQLERELNAARSGLGELMNSGLTTREAELERALATLQAACAEMRTVLGYFEDCSDTGLARDVNNALFGACGKGWIHPQEADKLRGDAARANARLDAHTRPGQCANCGERKPLPYRRDDLGGYVCLTCVERHLNAALDERDQLRAQVAAMREANPFPAISQSNAKALAFHVRQGKPFGGIDQEALAAWLDAQAISLEKYHAALSTHAGSTTKP